MKRLARHLFTACSALSLMLCVTLVFGYIGTYTTGKVWMLQRITPEHPIYRHIQIELGFGQARLDLAQQRLPPVSPLQFPRQWHLHRETHAYWYNAPHIGTFYRFGFGTLDEVGIRHLTLMMPIGIVVVVLAIMPAAWVFRTSFRHRVIASNLCLVCGYDLRASPERCPECGTAVMRATS
jgi:hypothetical protein